ncbi:MAG TPA: type II secretion system protein [Candidatus Dormibacteraeota bacterium]|nr:type II secretion system protein [Candidatus Dormibacteraeota bacterium]
MRLDRAYLRSQGGYTLIEVMIAVAIGGLLLTAITSVVLTSQRATDVATSRIEASSQIRNFQFTAYDDFARSAAPTNTGCAPSTPCTTTPLVLNGVQVSNGGQQVPAPAQVTYTYDGSAFVDRSIGGASTHAATDVSAFRWYVDNNGTLVVSMTVTISGSSVTYRESQTFLFYPRTGNP